MPILSSFCTLLFERADTLLRPPRQVDWDKWVDEDEEEEEGEDKMGGFDLSALQNFQNFGAMGGMGCPVAPTC